ncbi:hypothetical protein Tco_0664294 [Tanacetum coccineum]
MHSSSVSSDFIEKLLNFENISPADNKISSMMDTTIRHEEPSDQTSSLYTVPIMIIPEITSVMMSFGRHLVEIHMIWTQFGKKMDKILTLLSLVDVCACLVPYREILGDMIA